MGSKFMDDEEKLKLIFDSLKKKNLFFIDSRTTPLLLKKQVCRWLPARYFLITATTIKKPTKY